MSKARVIMVIVLLIFGIVYHGICVYYGEQILETLKRTVNERYEMYENIDAPGN